MKIKRFFYLLCCLLIAVATVGSFETSAAKKKTKATTTNTSSAKTKKKSTTSSKKKSTSASNKTGTSKKTGAAKKSSTGAKKKKNTSTSASKKKKTTSKNRKRSSRKRKVTPAYKPYTPPAEPQLNDSLTLLVNAGILEWIPENINPGGLRVNSVIPDKKSKTAKIGLNENFTYLPVTNDLITDMRKKIISLLPDSISDYSVTLNVGPRSYSYYITTIDKLPLQYRKNIPFVVDVNPFIDPKKGMEGDIIALWPSHGRYFKTGTSAWQWQRPQLFQETEDTHTMSYILPYVVPMLENAGAYVLLPRERDINRNEVIVDNDINDGGLIFSQPYYKEMTGTKKWETGAGEGFIYDLPDFRDTENPFENGTYRQTTTITSGNPSIAAWYADIPEDGEYAVYVSYKSLPNSTTDAHYTVNYSGGTKEFRVNQTMGGSTWIYLGTFPLEAGYSDSEPVVTLSNISSTADKLITADAVKIGGGMGNIARSDRRSDIFLDPSTPEEGQGLLAQDSDSSDDDEDDEEDEEDDTEGDDDDVNTVEEPEEEKSAPVEAGKSPLQKGSPLFKISGLPRYLEGARYWLQWAGMPEHIYSPYHGNDDYKDDYTSRGHWVNYLAGGSRVLPNQNGLNIPVDVVMALHSDAGKRADDSFVGTLGIFYTNGGDTYRDGTPRTNSRTLTDMLMRQITGDIRQTWEPQWKRRSMWDKSYVEARVPEVPTSLIELLSHQNFADMVYALDPSFRFTVSRSIYKALGRFIAERKDRKFVVQPLPVKDFYISKVKASHYKLSWKPSPDRLEPTAVPTKYIIMERTADELGFHYLGETSSTHFEVIVEDNDIHSFRIIAANEGGLSFPSETLALREAPGESVPVLIVNGFTRISGPASFANEETAGFKSDEDFGVPYKNDIMFIGYQTEFRRSAGESFGRSGCEYVDKVIAGNTFDYPYLHGVSIAEAGRGFVSASVGAVIDGSVRLGDYKTVDLILGKQKSTVVGNGNTGVHHTAFPKKLQDEIKSFVKHGGDIFISGAYLISDLEDFRSPDGSMNFASEVLGLSRKQSSRPYLGSVDVKETTRASMPRGQMKYSSTLNEKVYIVENPDLLSPSGKIEASTFMTFPDTEGAAGILTKNGKSNGAFMSIPFEAIEDQISRNLLMKSILDYLEK